MKTNKRQLLPAISACALLGLAAVGQVHAATIVGFDFATDANQSAKDANIMASTVVGGPGTTGAATTATSSTGWVTNSPDATARSSGNQNFFGRTASETALVSYVEFTVTPEAGFTMDLTNLSFNYGINSNYTAGTVDFSHTLTVRSSLDGFSTQIGTTGAVASVDQQQTTPDFFSTTLTGFDDLSTAVTFRLYAQKTFSDYTGGTYDNNRELTRWDNILIDGTTAAIPEPSAALLGSLGVLALLRRRRN